MGEGELPPGGDLLAPDADLVSVPERTQMRGREGISAYMRDFLEQWDDFRVEALDLTEVTFEQGRVVRVRWESDRATTLGLLE